MIELNGVKATVSSAIHIGPAGWSYPDWNGIVYPPRSRKLDHLEFLSSYFNLIEINSTFYRIPERATCVRWTERVAASSDFLFTVKLFQGFTHADTPLGEAEMNVFRKAISPIYETGRLGAVLVQFPWSFRWSDRARNRIARLTAWLQPLKSAVEVRHGSWRSPQAVAFFSETGTTMCSIDQPAVGDSIDSDSFVSGEAGLYIRLHGRNHAEWFNPRATRDSRYDYLYSEEETASWVKRISEQSKTASRTFVVLNNHFRGQAVANALEIKAQLTASRPAAPLGVVKRFPRIAKVVDPDDRWLQSDDDDDQMTLFE